MTTHVLDKLFDTTILQRFGRSLAILQGLLENRIIAMVVNQSLAKWSWLKLKLAQCGFALLKQTMTKQLNWSAI